MRFLFFIFSISLLAQEFPLKSRLKNADSGDYLVLSSGKMITLLSIHTNDPDSLILEEISVPSDKLEPLPKNWNEWIQKRAPGHTSWSMIELNPSSGEVLECYSFSKSSWIKINSEQSLFATLFKLPFQKILEQERKKIGPAPLADEPDLRRIWQPPAFFEGKKQLLHFDAFCANWPEDNSELSNKEILLYFDQEIGFCLPFWIELKASYAQLNFKTLAAGKQLNSPQKMMPRRTPQWASAIQKKENGNLIFKINTPKYYKNFDLYAVDITHNEKEIFPIEKKITQIEEELITIEISEEILKESLKNHHTYNWLLIPEKNHQAYTQSKHSFTWEEVSKN